MDGVREVESVSRSIIDISHEFFDEIVHPLLQREYPEVTARTAFGLFGHGSEALGMDDEHSRDHHWGIRIDALMPADVSTDRRDEIMRTLGSYMPETFRGLELGESTREGAGLVPDTLESFLSRTIGIDHAPETYLEWLELPEEDIVHLINGEVWHDPLGAFTAIRERLGGYYPEPIWFRRMGHWCRYQSGMGTYALKRAILRGDDLFATLAFAQTLRLTIQLAYMLDRTYFPYDKWLYTLFRRLPRMHERLGALVDESLSPTASWHDRLELVERMSDVVDETMVEDGIIPAHPKLAGSPTSGYRLLEHAYKVLLGRVPEEIRLVIPRWGQIHFERFAAAYIDRIDTDSWHEDLNLTS